MPSVAEKQLENSTERDLSNVPPQLRDHCFKPGESGNEGGRRKGSLSIGRLLREELKANDHEKAKEIVKALIDTALSRGKGAIRAIALIFDRIDGKVTDKVVEDCVINIITNTPGFGDRSGMVSVDS